MKIQKKSKMCTMLLMVMALAGCSAGGSYGTEKQPAGVQQMVVYDGMEASKEANRFKAEITLEDVVRGEEAEDVFAAAGGYASYHEELELEEDQELLIARFTVTITETVKDEPVNLGEKDVNMFKLISQDGDPYDYFLQRTYVDDNLFEDAFKGSTQTGCIFYLVDKADEKPNIVFLPIVNDGVWFKTALTASDKKLVAKPILAADWLDMEKRSNGSYGGTINNPLPIGEYGYMYCRSSYFGEYEIELRVDEILRGSEAEKKLAQLDSYGMVNGRPGNDQEYLLVKITVNVPSADMLMDSFLDFYVGDCRVINSNSGQEYDFENSIDFYENSVNAVLPGGTGEGWFGFVIDKNDLSPMMYYQSLDDKMLYYKLDKAYALPDDMETYVSVIPDQNPIRDPSCSKGDWKNPYGMGDTVKLDYKTTSEFAESSPFTGSMQVIEAYRGKAAEYFADGGYDRYYQDKYMEPVVLKLRVEVDSVKSEAPSFHGRNYNITTGRGGIIGTVGKVETFYVKDQLEAVYPGGTAEGYVGFLVPEGIEHLEIAYGNVYDGVNSPWIGLEFSEAPEEEFQELEDKTSGIFAASKGSSDMTDAYQIVVEDGIVRSSYEHQTYSCAEMPEIFDEVVVELEDTVQDARDMPGIKLELESDPETLLIQLHWEVDFELVNPNNIASIFESPYFPLTDGRGNVIWEKVKASLEDNGYAIEHRESNEL